MNFIKKMLAYDMNERISASDALKEPWIMKYAKTNVDITTTELRLTLNNLKNFRTQSIFQVAVLSYITSQQMSRREEERIREIFNSFDKDKNGQLTRDEVIEVLKCVHGDNKKIYKEADQIFKNIDLDNNGTIEYNGNFNNNNRISCCESKDIFNS